MISEDYMTVEKELERFFDAVCEENEIVHVTRKNADDFVIMSQIRFLDMEKMIHNFEYIKKLDAAFLQLEAGKGSVHELLPD